MKKPSLPRPKESQTQAAFINWWHDAHKGLGVPDARVLFSSLNGTTLAGGRTEKGVSLAVIRAVQAKRQGMVSGVPDLCLAVPRRGFHGLYIEMKRERGVPSDVKPEQREMHVLLRAQGYAVQVCFGLAQAVDVVVAYLAKESVISNLTRDAIKEMDPEMLLMDGFDDCIVGVIDRPGSERHVCYDREKVINKLVRDHGMTRADAEEYHEFNQAGSYMGERTPCFLDVIEGRATT